MKDICKTVGKVILVLSIIGGFLAAYFWGRTVDISAYSYERNVFLSILYFIFVAASGCCTSVIFFALGEIIEYLEGINYKIKAISDNMEQSESSVNVNKGNAFEEVVGVDEWKCSNCGKIIPNHTHTCSCGWSKR